MKRSDLMLELARAYRANSGHIIASLVRQFGDLDLAEDALHDACLNAEQAWANNRVPDAPAAWLYIAAKRRLMDRLRHGERSNTDAMFRKIDTALTGAVSEEAYQAIPDERLSLIFMCCHPSINTEAQVSLTLKTLCGLSAREIARAYLVSEAAMRKRLSRAKAKIKANQIPFEVPPLEDLPNRLHAVLTVIYLIYNESYSAFEGQSLTRQDLAEEAIRLARLVYALLPEAEVGGLLALMLLHQSRFYARQSASSDFVPLEEQDRSQWNTALIKEGRSILERELQRKAIGPFQLQAAISAAHATAKTWETTDWAEIIGLYQVLVTMNNDAVTRLNLYCAIAHSGQLELARKQLKSLAEALKQYQPYYAAMAYVESQLGNTTEASRYYCKAISLTSNDVEKTFLKSKLALLNR